MPFEKWVKKGKKITRPFVTLGRDEELSSDWRTRYLVRVFDKVIKL